MCTNGSCYRPDCRRCGPTMGLRRMWRAAMRWPYTPSPPRDASGRLIRVLAMWPRRIANLIVAPRAKPLTAPLKPVVRTRIQRMMPDHQRLAITETFGVIGTTTDASNIP